MDVHDCTVCPCSTPGTTHCPCLHPKTDAEVREHLRRVGESRRAIDDAHDREFAEMKAQIVRVEALADWFDAQVNWREWHIGSQIRSALRPSNPPVARDGVS